uniref:Uncharacterized protein n=2 Tax=Triticinae TaxID=1648030 RepID=A0A453JFX2_AEGTS
YGRGVPAWSVVCGEDQAGQRGDQAGVERTRLVRRGPNWERRRRRPGWGGGDQIGSGGDQTGQGRRGRDWRRGLLVDGLVAGGGGGRRRWLAWRRKTTTLSDNSRFQIRGIFVLLFIFTLSEISPSYNYFGTEGVICMLVCVLQQSRYYFVI